MSISFKSVNPWTGEIIAEFRPFSASKIAERLNQSALAFSSWKIRSINERLSILQELNKIILRERQNLALAMSEEMGKTLTEALAEIDKSRNLMDLLLEKSPEWIQEVRRDENGRKARIRLEALGGILLVMPWNFPLWQVCRAALPALCAGNVVLLKHAPNVFGFASRLEQLFLEAGFPDGVFLNLMVDVPALEGIIAHKAVAAVSFTGSENAGRSLAALAGTNLRKCVLELGGSDPFLVLGDADLATAAKMAVTSRMLNNGQSCIAAKRFMVQEDGADEFVLMLVRYLSEYKPGNPSHPNTRLGPLARPDLVKNLMRQYESSVKSGARERYVMQAAYPEKASVFLPRIVSHVKPGMACFDEETFGPLLSVSTFRTEKEAISLANQSQYGLGATIYSKDEEKANFIAGQLDCGSVAINCLMRSDPALPFGGIKASGYGKELGREGLEAFCNQKVILLN